MDNRTIAQRLMGMAHDLEGKQSNLYRIRAYRRAAQTVMTLDQPIVEIIAISGSRRLRDLPGIGTSISQTIADLAQAGDAPADESAAVTS
jgi:DNA polymerase (family 10)